MPSSNNNSNDNQHLLITVSNLIPNSLALLLTYASKQSYEVEIVISLIFRWGNLCSQGCTHTCTHKHPQDKSATDLGFQHLLSGSGIKLTPCAKPNRWTPQYLIIWRFTMMDIYTSITQNKNRICFTFLEKKIYIYTKSFSVNNWTPTQFYCWCTLLHKIYPFWKHVFIHSLIH